MKNRIMSGWNFMRVCRLLLGVIILIQGIQSSQLSFAIFGGLFTIMPLLNIGCCGISNCSIPVAKTNKKAEEITFEEIQ